MRFYKWVVLVMNWVHSIINHFRYPPSLDEKIGYINFIVMKKASLLIVFISMTVLSSAQSLVGAWESIVTSDKGEKIHTHTTKARVLGTPSCTITSDHDTCLQGTTTLHVDVRMKSFFTISNGHPPLSHALVQLGLFDCSPWHAVGCIRAGHCAVLLMSPSWLWRVQNLF